MSPGGPNARVGGCLCGVRRGTPGGRRPLGPAGFSLVEVLISSAIILTAAALACSLAIEAQGAWRAYSARVDLHQRTRVAGDLLTRALLDAGGGPHAGALQGPLIRYVAPVVPRRMGRRGADPPDSFRADAFTVFRADPDVEPGRSAFPVPPGAVALDLDPACDLPACGFRPGATALLLDALGQHDAFTVLGTAGSTLALRHHGAGSRSRYDAGTAVIAANVETFYVDAAHILRRYDGDAGDAPVVDDVVGMEVAYYGGVDAPVLPRPPDGRGNCLYEGDGSYRAALLPPLPDAGSGQARLARERLVDGPWCGAGDTRFDADLLRLRRVTVTVRLQASDPAVRGPDRARFANPGHAQRAGLMVPDATVVVDVRPRNLRVAW